MAKKKKVAKKAKQVVKKKGKKSPPPSPPLLRLDLGCGPNPKVGFEGVDVMDFGQPHKLDLRHKWPWKDGEVEEIHCSHFLEHMEPLERIHVVNEMWRVLRDGGKVSIIVPHWASCRAYGDLTHKWPPVSEMWFFYLNDEWRKANAPHNDGYACNFEATWGYSLHASLAPKNQEFQTFALNNYKEAAQDTVATLVKRPRSG